jgi:23S rRNA-/tRNA-specific pseudouridylate synthase/ubiquinone/menaquinone biosynthesis C-methylase UbiE
VSARVKKPVSPPPGVSVISSEGGVLVVAKPAGMSVEVTKSGASVMGFAGRLLGRLVPPVLVHGPDKAASGLVVIAADRATAGGVGRAMAGARASVNYLALVQGTLPAETGSVQARVREGSRGVVECVPEGTAAPDATPAVMHYRVEGTGNGLSLVRVRAETDGPGQVRAMLASLGCPVVGDRAHRAERDDLARLGLHLHEIVMERPGASARGGAGSGRGGREGAGEKDGGRGGPTRWKAPAPAAFWEKAGLTPPADAAASAGPAVRTDEGWQHVAGWYDDLVEKRSDHHVEVVEPGVVKMLAVRSGERVLDVACGSGQLCGLIARQGAEAVGVDASAGLIEAARARAGDAAGVRFEMGDARRLGERDDLGVFDAAACVLALMNIDPIEPVLAGIATRLRAGGRVVAVVMHPAFRVPRASAWGWDEDEGGRARQFRRVDRYLSATSTPIVMNPGAQASGHDAVTVSHHHRPVSALVSAFAAAGLLIDGMEEWCSVRESEPGPRAEAENRARREFPMFLAVRAVKLG